MKKTILLLLFFIAPVSAFGGDVLTKTLPADYVVSSDASPNETDLQVNVVTPGTYDLKVSIHSKSDARALKMMLTGSAVMEAFIAQWTCSDAYDSTVLFTTRRSLPAGIGMISPSVLDGRNAFCSINGSVEFSTAGTFILRGAQTIPDPSNTTMLKGSTMVLTQTD